jgi:hypothetical protein
MQLVMPWVLHCHCRLDLHPPLLLLLQQPMLLWGPALRGALTAAHACRSGRLPVNLALFLHRLKLHPPLLLQ